MHNRLTRKDIEKMQEEIDYRKLVLRPKVLEEVKETRAQGDLSENFEYHAAKKAKGQNDGRIRFLEKMIKTAEIIEDESADNEVGINKEVTVYIPEEDLEETYTIVSTIRENIRKRLISLESPMGKALMKHKEGDTVTIRVNESYSYPVIIRSIKESASAEDADLSKY